MTGETRGEIARLRWTTILLAWAGGFFAASLIAHLARGGGLRAVDIALPLWILLFLVYLRRWRAAVARARDGDRP